MKDIQQRIDVRRDYQISRGAVKCENGLTVKHVACAIFDTAANDSSGVSNKTVAAHGLGVYLPAKAIITRAWYDIATTFADGASDAATIAFGVPTDGASCFTAAIAISDASNVWDAGLHGTLIAEPALDGNARSAIAGAAAISGAMLKLTAEREITATVAVHALTAGKLALFVEYFIGL